jgi:hypothetical protein
MGDRIDDFIAARAELAGGDLVDADEFLVRDDDAEASRRLTYAGLKTALDGEYTSEFVVTDITDAQSVIDAAEAAGGGAVWFKVGGTLTAGLVVDADNVHLRGNGVTLTASGAIDLVTLRNVKNCSVDGFRIDGNWQSGRGIVLEGALYCKIGTYQGISGDRINNWMFDLRADGAATQNTAGCSFGSLSVDNTTRFMHFRGNASPLRPVANNNFHAGIHAVSALTADTIMFDFEQYADNNAFQGVTRIQLQRAGDIGVRYNTDATMREVYENHFWGGLLVDVSNNPKVIDAYNTQHSPVVGDTYVFLRANGGTVSTTSDSTVEVVRLEAGGAAVRFPTVDQLAQYAPVASPTFTGNVVVPAATAGTHAAQVSAINAATGQLAIGGIEIGDTGWRKILSWTAGVQDGSDQIGTINTTDFTLNGTGYMSIRRVGNIVFVGLPNSGSNTIAKNAAGISNLLTANVWPTGFHISTQSGRQCLMANAGSEPATAIDSSADFAGTVQNLRLGHTDIDGLFTRAQITYTVNNGAWPATLPGTVA